MYDELLLRCGVNIIIPARNIDGSVLGGRPQSALGAETSDESPHLSVLAVFLGIFSYTLLRVTRQAWPMTKHHTQTVSPKRSCLGESSCQLPLAYWTFKSLLVEESPW